MEIIKPEVTEVCPHCSAENTFVWDVESDGYTTFCPHCGGKMMLCDMCRHSDDNTIGKCDWCESLGCWRERYEGGYHKIENPGYEPIILEKEEECSASWGAMCRIFGLPEHTSTIKFRLKILEWFVDKQTENS